MRRRMPKAFGIPIKFISQRLIKENHAVKVTTAVFGGPECHSIDIGALLFYLAACCNCIGKTGSINEGKKIMGMGNVTEFVNFLIAMDMTAFIGLRNNNSFGFCTVTSVNFAH